MTATFAIASVVNRAGVTATVALEPTASWTWVDAVGGEADGAVAAPFEPHFGKVVWVALVLYVPVSPAHCSRAYATEAPVGIVTEMLEELNQPLAAFTPMYAIE